MLSVSIDEIKFKGMNSERLLLENIRFALEAGKIFTILGKNGSGKSTLVKSITGLLDRRFYIVAGEVIFEGENILKMPVEKLLSIRRNKIKYVFQDAANSFDSLKRLKYYFSKSEAEQKERESLLEYFLLPGSDELSRLYPYEISGGMAQRVSLVLSLLARPKLLILDEPTSGIDSAIANLMLLKLKEFASGGNSVLLVTQDLMFAKKISSGISHLRDKRLSPVYNRGEFLNINEFSDPGNIFSR
jgi:peptide/nickel transport system ATP-binding protein